MLSSRVTLLLWLFVVHLAGIYLFTGGFLLTRLSLYDLSSCDTQDCNIAPSHKRAVLLIIDSLRFDFLTPNPPSPASPYHHNVLTLPRELTATRPKHSFIFNSYADPPTTTLQRIKGITTGSLPTFIDIGNNFGGSSIAEDSILKQLKAAGRKLAFMGDDTWMSVFPDTFEHNMTFPFDSFNVEDLHTVDEGVITHLFPLLEDPSKPFDFLIGHFLGVDHVGHRVGPDHPSMKAKLQQMNDVLTRVVKNLDDDTLLIVLGDHGMDRSGDHGGDGVLETSAAMWIYSKGPALMQDSHPIPSGLLRYKAFPETKVRHRAIQQIDILPTLSLLLGLPIPYNNLGSIIPELFWRGDKGKTLERALRTTAGQVNAYLNTYRASASGGELDEAWDSVQSAWKLTADANLKGESRWITLMNFNLVALAACRAMWAQFNPLLMSFGLSLLGMGLCAAWAVYSGLSSATNDWEGWLSAQLSRSFQGAAAGAILGVVASLCIGSYLPGIGTLHLVLFAGPLLSSMTLIISSPPPISLSTLTSIPIILILHSVAFLSNSFTFWEDRIVPFFLVTSIIPYSLTGFSAPSTRLRYRILGFSLLFALCVRLMSISTICREEQQPYCHVTFYASSSLPSPPWLVLCAVIPVALALPYVIKRFLKISMSDRGVARHFFPFILSPTLAVGTLYWIMEWADSATVLGEEWAVLLRLGRTWAARAAFGWLVVGGGSLWLFLPLCIDIHVTQTGENKQIQILGYANAYGAPYLVFWTIGMGAVWISTQLTGQVVLALSTVALISYLEVLDSYRDAQAIQAVFNQASPSRILDPNTPTTPSSVRFRDTVPLALLGLHAFYGTGHQATIASIQWKSAFLMTPTLNYPFSVLTVVLNSIGPVWVFALAVPLVGMWNRDPGWKGVSSSATAAPPGSGSAATSTPSASASAATSEINKSTTLAALSLSSYYLALLLGSALGAAILRRHLMVWKVFAPRFMLGVLLLVVVDVGVLLGVGVGVGRVGAVVNRVFGAGVRTSGSKGSEKKMM